MQCPHLSLRQQDGERDWAMKMKDGSTNGRAVIRRTEEGVGGSEIRQRTTVTAEWAYLSAHPSFSVLICRSSMGHLLRPSWKTRAGVIKQCCGWDLHLLENKMFTTKLVSHACAVVSPAQMQLLCLRSLQDDGKQLLLLFFSAQ